jgi:hypothetical protein
MALRGTRGSIIRKLQGFDIVLANANKAIADIEGRTVQGLVKAAQMIEREMKYTPPIIPEDTGNLKQSFYIVAPTGGSSVGMAGLRTPVPNFIAKDANTNVIAITQSYYQAVGEAQAKVRNATKSHPIVVLGFGAPYTVYVHEMLGNVNWTKRNSGPKFFESALKRNASKLLSIIAANAKIK